jgi:hypothetical protein
VGVGGLGLIAGCWAQGGRLTQPPHMLATLLLFQDPPIYHPVQRGSIPLLPPPPPAPPTTHTPAALCPGQQPPPPSPPRHLVLLQPPDTTHTPAALCRGAAAPPPLCLTLSCCLVATATRSFSFWCRPPLRDMGCSTTRVPS